MTVKQWRNAQVDLAEHNIATLHWVTGHQGNPGNEAKDFLVKEGKKRGMFVVPEPTWNCLAMN